MARDSGLNWFYRSPSLGAVADKRISELNPLSSADLDANQDVLAVADLSATETKKVTPTALIVGSVGVVPDGTIPGSKIEPDSITSLELAPDSVTDVELADNAVDTGAIQDKAVTQDKLADGAVGTDQLADGVITGDKLADGAIGDALIADRSIEAVKLVQNTLTAEEIAPNAIGSSELANGAVDTAALQDDACTTPKYQNASVTNEKLADGIDGGKLIDGSVPGSKLEPGSITGDSITEISLDKLPDAGPNTVLAGPTSGVATTPAYRKLVPVDLPTAKTDTIGGSCIPANGGLAVNSAGAVSIDNTVTPGGYPFVNFNGHGLITSGRALSGTDLPPPTLGQPGAVKPGNGLEVTGDGTLNVIPATDSAIGGVIAGDGISVASDGKISQSLTGVVAGTYTKLTVDEMGNATLGELLSAEDIPTIEWDQINNPNVDSSALADKSVMRRHLADYAISYIQEDPPPIDPTVLHIGCLWFSESTSRLAMWNGNSWYPIGIGRIQMENLRYCGVFNGDTGLVSGVTKFGTEAGLTEGNPVPTATDELTGVYLICETAGSNVAEAPGLDFAAGDWLLCNGELGGWVKIAVLAGGGGGGGAQRLDDLLDVTLSTPTEDDILQLASDGKWKNVKVLSAGTY